MSEIRCHADAAPLVSMIHRSLNECALQRREPNNSADAATAINIAQRLGGPMATMMLALLLQYLSGPGANTSTGLGLVTIGAFHAGFALPCVFGLFCILAASRLPDIVEPRR